MIVKFRVKLDMVENIPKFCFHKFVNKFNSFDKQHIGRPLILTDDTTVQPFEAEDEDGGIFGDITFEIANYASGK